MLPILGQARDRWARRLRQRDLRRPAAPDRLRPIHKTVGRKIMAAFKGVTGAAAALVAAISLAQAQDMIPVELSLGDVSLNKVAFLVAADNGIYEKNGLKVRQF